MLIRKKELILQHNIVFTRMPSLDYLCFPHTDVEIPLTLSPFFHLLLLEYRISSFKRLGVYLILGLSSPTRRVIDRGY